MKILKYFIIIVIIFDLIALGLFGIFKYHVSSPVDANDTEPRTVIIESGWGVQNIARELEDEGVINKDIYFTLYTVIENSSHKLQAGVYELNASMSIREIAEIMQGGATGEFARVTIPEGFTKEQIAERLEEEGAVKDGQEFLNIANISTQRAYELFGIEFLSEINADSLEGFLFPDTYEFHLGSDADKAIEKFLVNFESKTQDIQLDYDTLIAASLVEKEVQTEEDMKLVAGILNNRLGIDMALQIDATLAYITGKKTGELRNVDKLIDSPYNTYLYRGLPPAPIANPGIQAINAVLEPTPSNYFYYLNDVEGNTYFSETLEQHNENKARYLR